MEHHHFFRKECSNPETTSKNLIKSRTQSELRNELDTTLPTVSINTLMMTQHDDSL